MDMASHPEQLLISATLREKDHITPMAQGINKDLFHVYRDEWGWIERYVRNRRRTPSLAAFRTKFPDFRIIKVDDVEHYVDEVKQSHMKYSLISMLDQTADLMETESDMATAIKNLHAMTLIVQSQVEGVSNDVDIISNWGSIYENVASRVEKVGSTGLAGVPTGFKTLDQYTSGPSAGQYWVVAARLGQGKTWTGIRMACAASFAGYTVQYFSLEQTRTQIALRTHSFMQSQYGQKLFKHIDLQHGQNFDLIKYKKFLRELKNHLPGKFFVSDASNGRISGLSIAAQIELNRPDIVFIDYLTLMDKEGEDWTSIAGLSSDIKAITQRYNIPVVVLAQINRQGIGKEPPETHHLAQSDRIGQDADVIVTLKKMSPHVVKMRLAKHRHGQEGMMWWCKFTPNTGQFDEISGDEAQEMMVNDMEDY